MLAFSQDIFNVCINNLVLSTIHETLYLHFTVPMVYMYDKAPWLN